MPFTQYKRKLKANASLLAALLGVVLGNVGFAKSTDALDILGLKLGMTFEEAKAALKRHKPDIWTVTYYMTESRRTWTWAPGYGITPQGDAGGTPTSVHFFHDAALHVPVHVGAGYFDHVYSTKPELTEGDKQTPIEEFSGEFFSLFFTPTDAGGKLYAIVRQREYFSNPSYDLNEYLKAKIELPSTAELKKGLVTKYGEPSEAKAQDHYVSLVWNYDQAGQKLDTTAPDFGRCQSTFDGEDGMMKNNMMQMGRPQKRYEIKGKLHSTKKWGMNGASLVGSPADFLTLRELGGAFEGSDFFTITGVKSKTDLNDDVRKLDSLVPSMVSNSGNSGNYPSDQSYAGCGVQLHAVIMPTHKTRPGVPGFTDTEYAASLTISLSDQSAVFANNGTKEYVQARVEKLATQPDTRPKVVLPTAKKEKF